MSFQPGQEKRLCFYSTPVQDCNYLAGRKSTTAFLDPGQAKDTWLYTLLSQHGFRRSGKHIYRPNCESCSACVAVRVAVDAFRPRRIQRRIWARNQELTVTPGNSTYREESFLLYHRYLAARHAGGSMENPTRTQYAEFLESGWADTTFFEFRLAGQLVAIAVSDHLTDSLSAVYSFFEPTMQRRSLGVYVVLWQIEHARRLALQWLYLGYWIKDCDKMRYKQEYLPQQRFINGEWLAV